MNPGDFEIAPRGIVFLKALRVTVLRLPLWLMVWALFALLALVGTLPWFTGYRDAMANRYEPGELVANLDGAFRADHADLLAALSEGSRATTSVLALLAMLAGAFAAGGWLQVSLERTQHHTLRRFFHGGSRYFFRFFRLLLLTLLCLHVAGWIAYGTPWEVLVEDGLLGLPGGDLEQLGSERTAVAVVWAQAGLFGLLFGLILTWGDYTRTRLALFNTSSTLWAGLATWFVMLRHPVRTLRPMLGLFLVEVAVLAGAAILADSLEGSLDADSGRWSLLLLLATGQVALLWSIITRGARYHAAVAVSRWVVRAPDRPDPWKQTLGGPGGPRYPIGGDDEYGVAL